EWLAADALPVVAGGIPDAPAAVFMEHRMHRADGAAAGRAIQDWRFLHAPEVIAAIGGYGQAGERQELGLGHALETHVEHVQAARCIDDVAEDHAVVVEAAAAPDVEHRLAADAHDGRGIVRPHVDVADAADAVGVAKARIDADGVGVETPWRRRERRVQHPAAHAMARGIEHQSLLGPLGHAFFKASRRGWICRAPPWPASRRRSGPARYRA